MQLLTYPKPLVLDEIGYLPMSREESSLFFRLVTRRYEKASTILTSNKSFSDWGEIFGDQVIATAILDRLLHHATTVNIKGESYRLKEKRKAGLLRIPSSQARQLDRKLNLTGSQRSQLLAKNGHLNLVKSGTYMVPPGLQDFVPNGKA